MAHSRLEKIGTIYSRVTGLIKAGAMKLEDRPIWYEVYQAFPPKYPPQFDRVYPEEPVKSIFYPEDVIRAKFYKAMKNAPIPNLVDTEHQTPSQKCIELCLKLQTEKNSSLDEAFEEALSIIRGSSKSEKEKEASETKNVKPLDVKDLFN